MTGVSSVRQEPHIHKVNLLTQEPYTPKVTSVYLMKPQPYTARFPEEQPLKPYTAKAGPRRLELSLSDQGHTEPKMSQIQVELFQVVWSDNKDVQFGCCCLWLSTGSTKRKQSMMSVFVKCSKRKHAKQK